MRCYSHLSDDEREQIGLARLWAIRLARLPKRSAGRGRRSRASSRATSCRAGAAQFRRFTPPEPINCAGGVKRGSKEIEPYGPSLSTGSRKGGPRSKFQAGSRAETNLACGPWVARRSTPSSTGQRNRPSSYGVTSRAITNAAARADRDLRKIPSRIASPSTNGPSMSRPEPRAATGRVTSSFVSVHGQCSFSMSANRA